MKPDKAADGALMSDLIRELVFTYFRLRAAGDELAIRYGQSTGKWGMMRSLREGGPQSVSQIARSRPVARQGVQRMANELARDGLIEFVDNPTHRRAKLMKLTRKGEKILTRLRQSELGWTGGFARRFSRRDIEKAMEVVRALKNTLARA
jgi:DNA-binding MarR family transcriptional regulator